MKKFIIPLLVLVASLVVLVLALARLLSSEHWITVPQHFEPAGVDLDLSRCGDEPYLRALVDDGNVWTICSADEATYPGGGLARLDPESGTMSFDWPLPDPDFRLYDAVGVSESPAGDLALVYRLGIPDGPNTTRQGGLAVAVAGPDGWAVGPVAFPDEGYSYLLGMAWNDTELEMVILPPGPEEDLIMGAPVVIRLTPDGETDVREVPRGSVCREIEYCGFKAARRTGDEWRFVVMGVRQVDGTYVTSTNYWDVGTEGDAEARPDLDITRNQLDNTANGVLHTWGIGQIGAVIEADGTWSEPVADPWTAGGWIAQYGAYELVDGRLSLITHWSSQTMGEVFQQVDGRRVRSSTNAWTPNYIFHALMLQPDNGRTTFPAMLGWGIDHRLTTGVFVEREQGGHWLVAPEGAYVALDEDLERADPMCPFEHLSRLDRVVPLFWVLFGLPPCILLGVLIAWFLARRSDERSLKSSLAIPLTVTVTLYLVSAAWALNSVWLFLR